MKKKFKNTKFAKIAGGILKGALGDTLFPVVGMVAGAAAGAKESIKNIKEQNLQDEIGGQGKPNYVRWISFGLSAMVLIFLILSAFGVIDAEQAIKIIDSIEETKDAIPLQ